MQFLMKDNPLTVQNLQQMFQVSRSTIQASIKKFNHDLSSYSIALKGYKKKGYYLKGKQLYADMAAMCDRLKKQVELLQQENFLLKESNEYYQKNCSEPKVKRQSHLVLNSFLYLMRPNRYWKKILDMWMSPINARRSIKKYLVRSVQNSRICQKSNDYWIFLKKIVIVNNVDLIWSVLAKNLYVTN